MNNFATNTLKVKKALVKYVSLLGNVDLSGNSLCPKNDSSLSNLLLRFHKKREIQFVKMSTECAGCRILKFYMAKDAFTQSVLCVLSPRVFELDLKVSNF